jgi:hypothetical protein
VAQRPRPYCTSTRSPLSWSNGVRNEIIDVWQKRNRSAQDLSWTDHRLVGVSFQFRSRGHILRHGANWGPADFLIPRLTRDDYRANRGAAVAIMNLIRAWGAGITKGTNSYECCDEWASSSAGLHLACRHLTTFDDDLMESVEA